MRLILTTWSLEWWSRLSAVNASNQPIFQYGNYGIRVMVSPGSILAVLLWIIASAAFSLYVANFGSYNKTYGALAGMIIFLVWLWITNMAVLFGVELDAELQRARAIEAGHPPEKEPYAQPRDAKRSRRKKST